MEHEETTRTNCDQAVHEGGHVHQHARPNIVYTNGASFELSNSESYIGGTAALNQNNAFSSYGGFICPAEEDQESSSVCSSLFENTSVLPSNETTSMTGRAGGHVMVKFGKYQGPAKSPNQQTLYGAEACSHRKSAAEETGGIRFGEHRIALQSQGLPTCSQGLPSCSDDHVSKPFNLFNYSLNVLIMSN